jgi:solute carrier family 25 (adenine nucleotide translocator) protein 4/5/6/31
MADGSQYPSVYQKISGQSYLCSRHFPNCQAWTSNRQNLPTAGGYVNGGLHSTLRTAYTGTASYLASPLPPVFVGAPTEKYNYASVSPFLKEGVEAFCLTAVAPIQRVKLLIQCQDEMIKSGRLSKPYKGIVDCFARTISNEGFLFLWRGNIPNVIHFFSNKVNFSNFFLLIVCDHSLCFLNLNFNH